MHYDTCPICRARGYSSHEAIRFCEPLPIQPDGGARITRFAHALAEANGTSFAKELGFVLRTYPHFARATYLEQRT